MPIPTGNNGAQGFGKKDNEEKQFDPIPEDTYEVEIVRVNRKHRNDAKFWPSFKKWDEEIGFGLKVTEGSYSKRWVWYNVPISLEENREAITFPDLSSDTNKKLRLALQEIIGLKPLPQDLEIRLDELDEFIGYTARARVTQWISKDGSKSGNDVAEVLAPAYASTYEDVEEVF